MELKKAEWLGSREGGVGHISHGMESVFILKAINGFKYIENNNTNRSPLACVQFYLFKSL